MNNSIEIKNIRKEFGSNVAVNNVNLNIKKGELFALLGVNGAGKTTMIKMLTGLLKPTKGTAILEGYSIIDNVLDVKKIVNVSPQETAIAPNLTVKENLEFMAGVYQIKNGILK